MFKKVFAAALLTYTTSALKTDLDEPCAGMTFISALAQLGDSKVIYAQQNEQQEKEDELQEWVDMIKLMDKNGNNKISWWEVKRYIKNVERKSGKKFSDEMRQKLKEHFDNLDADNNGQITKEEFINSLENDSSIAA